MSESNTIADMLNYARKFNLYYINKLDPERIHEPLVANGISGNSAYWLIGHLIWAEADVLMSCLNENVLPLPWLSHFAIRQDQQPQTELPDLKTLRHELEATHRIALEVIRKQTPEDLEKEAYVRPAKWHTTRKKGLFHCVRHESYHTGQFGLIAKVQGADTP
ncbi:MAG: DinB family protein [Bacteroidota bacterium]